MAKNAVTLKPRLLLTLGLMLLTVPWWPALNGRIAGLPAWAAFTWIACLVYAGVVAWLLERRWDDGAEEASPEEGALDE